MTTGVQRGAVLLGAIMFLGVGASAAQVWRGEAGLEVRVSSRKGGDLAGARVELMYRGGRESSGPPPVATDSRGRAVILGLAAGTWQVEVKHPEYMSYVAVVQLDAKEKPEITASFLEASVGGSVPIQVKLAKARGGPASPPLPVIAETAPPTREPAPAPTPTKATPAPPAQQPAAPQPGVPGPSTPELAPPEPSTPEAKTPEPAMPEETPAPAASTPPAVDSPTPEAPRAAPTPTPAPEPTPAVVPAAPARAPADGAGEPPRPAPQAAAEPSAKAVTPEPTTAPSPPPEAPAQPQPATPEAPASKPVPPVPAPTQPLPTPEPARPQPTIPPRPAPSPAPEPALEPPSVEPAPVSPPSVESAPSPSTPAAAPQPAPAPTAEPARPRSTPAAAPPVPQWRSYRQRTCPECRAGEWAVTVAARMSGGPACDDAASEAASAGAGMLGGRGELELAGFAGPLDGAAALVAEGPATEIAGRLAAADAGGCRLLGIVLPKSSRFVGFQYEVENAAGRQPCLPDQPCPGGTDFAGPPRIMRGPAATVIHALAHGPDGLALLTVYFRAPNDDWAPQP